MPLSSLITNYGTRVQPLTLRAMMLNDLTGGPLLFSLVKFGYQLPATSPRSISCTAIMFRRQILYSTDLGHVHVTQVIIMFMWQRRTIYVCLAFSSHHSVAPKISDSAPTLRHTIDVHDTCVHTVPSIFPSTIASCCKRLLANMHLQLDCNARLLNGPDEDTSSYLSIKEGSLGSGPEYLFLTNMPTVQWLSRFPANCFL